MILLGCCCHSWWKLKEKAYKMKISSWCLWFLKYEMSIACISICVNNIICYYNMSKWKYWTQMVLMIHMYNLRILKEHHAESHITRSLRPRISHCKNCMALALRKNSSTFPYLLSWRYENAKDIKLPTKMAYEKPLYKFYSQLLYILEHP